MGWNASHCGLRWSLCPLNTYLKNQRNEETDESVRNPMCHTQAVDSFAFSAKAWSHMVPVPHHTSFLTHRSICCADTASVRLLWKTNSEWPRFYSCRVIFNLDYFTGFKVQLHKKKRKNKCLHKWGCRELHHGRTSGQRQGVLKKNIKSSSTWVTSVGIQVRKKKKWYLCCTLWSITL